MSLSTLLMANWNTSEVIEHQTLITAWNKSFQNEQYGIGKVKVTWYSTSFGWGWTWAWWFAKFDLTWLPAVATEVLIDLNAESLHYVSWEIRFWAANALNYLAGRTRSQRVNWTLYRNWVTWWRWYQCDITDIYNQWQVATLVNDWIQIQPVNDWQLTTNSTQFSWFNDWVNAPKLIITT